MGYVHSSNMGCSKEGTNKIFLSCFKEGSLKCLVS